MNYSRDDELEMEAISGGNAELAAALQRNGLPTDDLEFGVPPSGGDKVRGAHLTRLPVLAWSLSSG